MKAALAHGGNLRKVAIQQVLGEEEIFSGMVTGI
jgi:hypothetical protein